MDKDELEKYEYQLSQINLALVKDPSNSEYLNLRDELTSLIDLTREYLDSTAPPAAAPAPAASTSRPRPSVKASTSASTSTSASATLLKSGEECQARYSGDGKFYSARITSVGGSADNRVYSVLFSGYDTTELVAAADVKPLSDTKKRALEVSEQDLEKEKRRKKMEKKKETREVKTEEQGSRQKSWQSFAKKSTKKGVHIPGIAGDSMFKSPEDLNPNARVGVVGSGRAMTAAVAKVRQTFKED